MIIFYIFQNQIYKIYKNRTIFTIMDEFQRHIEEIHYIVLSNDGMMNAFTSLRIMAQKIEVDFSTISKKLNTNNGDFCYCTSKKTHIIYYIKKM